MRSTGNKRRRTLRLAFYLALLLVGLLASLPIWFPWALKPILAHYQIHFKNYDRQGFNRFTLLEVQGDFGSARFDAARVEGVLPARWIWRRWIAPQPNEPMLAAADWNIVVVPTKETEPGNSTNSFFTVLDEVLQITRTTASYLPALQATNGVVTADSSTFRVSRATLQSKRLETTLLPPQFPHPLRVTASFADAAAVTLSASIQRSSAGETTNRPVPAAGTGTQELPGTNFTDRLLAALDPSLELKLTREPSKWRLQGSLAWQTNHADLSAEILPGGWWPAQARLETRDLRVPPDWLSIPGYNEPALTLAFSLVSNRFDLKIAGTAQPASGVDWAPRSPWEGTVRVQGDPEVAIVEELELHGPWLRARLNGSLGIQRTGQFLTNAGLLTVTVDLAALPGEPAEGRLEGNFQMDLADSNQPTVRFSLAATNVCGWGMGVEFARSQGTLKWPLLTLEQGDLRFNNGGGLAITGSTDFSAKKITEAQWRLWGDVLPAEVDDVRYRQLAASGKFAGPFSEVVQSGTLTVEGAQLGNTKVFDGRVEWTGTNLNQVTARMDLTAGLARLAWQGAGQLVRTNGFEIRAVLNEAAYHRDNVRLYSIPHPCSVHFESGGTNTGPTRWRCSVQDLECLGENNRLSLLANLQWPEQGMIQLNTTNVSLAEFGDFLPAAATNVSLTQLNWSASWSNSPIQSTLTVAGLVDPGIGAPLNVRGAVRLGESLEVAQLSVQDRSTNVLTIAGRIPIAITPNATNGWWRADNTGPLQLKADFDTSHEVKLPLGRDQTLQISQIKLVAAASGTLGGPTATLDARVAACEFSRKAEAPGPRLESVHVNVSVVSNRIDLRSLTATLDGQPLEAQGEWPVAGDFWQRLPAQEWSSLDWSAAKGRLQIPKAHVSVLARRLPSVLAPEGELKIDLALEPGRKLSGALVITNAATRPLGQLTALRDINARLGFNGQEATLEQFRGQMGGQPVWATGRLQLRPAGGWDYQTSLRGTNLPLARSVEFLLRGNVDLQLKGGGTEPPQLSGTIDLKDGLFVKHASALIWSQPERPALRPPYFSVTNQPFADWKIDLLVQGLRFLRVRTPIFTGGLSANFRLQGTLRDPIAAGEARIDSGRVLFPFGVLQTDQGSISLSGHDPRGPELLINASGKNYRYDIHMEVSGSADGAKVTFNSTPPLNSEEILLMLTAGELPRDEVIFSAEARAGRLATYLGKDLLSRYLGNDTSGDRLIINTTENISEDGKTTYTIEYRLTDRWSLLGEYDRFNAINAAVKWKVYSR